MSGRSWNRTTRIPGGAAGSDGVRRDRGMQAVAWALSLASLLTILAAAAPTGTAQSTTQPWTTPVDDALLPTGPEGRHYRVTARVDVNLPAVRDLPVQRVLDLAAILAANGHPAEEASGRVVLQGFALDLDSFLLHEVDEGGRFLQRLPIAVFPGSVEDEVPFDAQRNPTVTARWIMPGQTTQARYFHVYFDAVHNDVAPAPPLAAADEVQLATSVGPGRGTTLYVPLHPLTGQQLDSEARRVRVTALHDGTDVAFHEYRGGVPLPDAIETVEGLDAGQVHEYVLGANGNQPSEGSIQVRADRPVLAEALSVPTGKRSSFVPNDFVPAADGGMLGRSFLATPTAPETWHLFCPRVAAVDLGGGQTGCAFTVGGQSFALGANGGRTASVPAGQTTTVMASAGALLVQREGTGMTFWPPADGPRAASEFLGYAGVGDQLLLTAVADGTCALVQSRARGDILADKGGGRLCMDAGGFHDCLCSWGTTMDRRWETGKEHTVGDLRIEAHTGDGLGVTAGPIEHPTNFNSLVVPQSPDGGLTYRIHVPAAPDGAPLGSIALFALQDGTEGVATLPDGTRVTIPSLRTGERFDVREEAGTWTIEMRRPVVAAWLKTGAVGSFGAYAPGFTDVATVEVTDADYAGHALGVAVQGTSFLQRQPGDLVQFTLDVTNRARDTAGGGMEDTVTVRLEAPEGWSPDVRPATRVLAPGATGSFSLQANIPQAVSGSGATLRAVVTSDSNPDLEVDQILQVSYVIRRGVEVIELQSANHGEAQRNIGLQETANYTVRVTNKGSAPDAFDLRFSQPPERWIQAVTPQYEGDANRTPELAPGEHVDLFLDVTPGPEVNLASKLVTRVSATSVADRSVTDSLRAVTVVGVDRSFRVLVDAPTRTVDPGGETTFQLTIVNDAEVNEELRVEVVSSLPPGWSDATVRWLEEDADLGEVDNTIRLDALGTATLSLTRAVPADAAPLALSIDRLRMQSQFDRDTPASDTSLRVLAATLRGVGAALEVPAQAVDPGDDVPVTLRLTSEGNIDQTLRVTPLLPPPWTATDADGASAPWDVEVPAFGAAELPLTLRVPPGTPPGEAPVSVALGAFGVATSTVDALLDVNQRSAVAASDGTFRLDPGRLLRLDVPVRNVGNTEVLLDGRWTGLPDWDVSTESLRLGPGDDGTLRTWLQVPADIPRDTLVEARVEVTDGADAKAVADWVLSTNVPRLQATLQGVRPAGDDLASYTVLVSNVGLDAAHNVSVLLDDPEGGTVDRFVFNQVLPGASSTAVLLGPADASGVTLRVVADHDPAGILLPVDEDGGSDAPLGRLTPAPALPPLLAVLGVLAATRRWRR